jgi:hypothetical protein
MVFWPCKGSIIISNHIVTKHWLLHGWIFNNLFQFQFHCMVKSWNADVMHWIPVTKPKY